MIKAIALDIDGTLYNSQDEIMPLTKDTLLKAHGLGITLILVSGRSIHGLQGLVKKHKIPLTNTILIGFNGGSIVDASNGAILFEKDVDHDLAVKFIQSAQAYHIVTMIPWHDTLLVEEPDDEYVQYEAQTEGMKIKVVPDLSCIDFSPSKIMFATEPKKLDQYLAQLPVTLKNEASFLKSAPHYLDINSQGLDKGIALQYFCDLKGITASEVIAFGDNFNDMAMLEFAGVSVAMGNAVEELKKVANYVTLSNNEDGIGCFLRKYFQL